MKSTLQRVAPLLAVAACGLAMVAPAAFAGDTPQNNPGQVATRLGSPDPREHSLREGAFAGLVPTLLGSQDPRDAARAATPNARFPAITIRAAFAGASYTSSIVASRLGSPDPRDTARS
jgi:hypothetical protein